MPKWTTGEHSCLGGLVLALSLIGTPVLRLHPRKSFTLNTQQLAHLDAAVAEKDEQRVMTARRGRCIHLILETLLTLATSQEMQITKIEMQRGFCDDGLAALARLDKSSAEPALEHDGYQSIKAAQHDIRKRLRKVVTSLTRRETMLASLGETV